MQKKNRFDATTCGSVSEQNDADTAIVPVVYHTLQQLQMVPPDKFAQVSKICAGVSKICDGMSLLYDGMSSDLGGDLSNFPKQLTSLLTGAAQINTDGNDGSQLSNHARDQRIYELSLNPDLTWGIIAGIVNQEFKGEQLDDNSAPIAAKRHQEANNLPPIPKRKPGRKPKGQSE